MNIKNVDIQRIFDAAPECYLVLAPDGPRFTYLAVTDAYLHETKTGRNEILGKGVFEVFPDNPEDPTTQAVAFATASFQRVVDTRSVDVMGIRKHDIRRPESEGGGFEERLWKPVNFPILGDDGGVACIIHQVEDVTESIRRMQKETKQQSDNIALRDARSAALNLMRDAVAARQQAEQTNERLRMEIGERKRVEDALRESEARLRSVLDNNRDVIYRLNMQTGRYEYVSRSAEAVVGFSADELMAMDSETALSMVHPDDLPAMRAGLVRLAETGEGELEYRQQTKSGDYRWISNHISIIKDSDGHPPYRNGHIRDITQLKRAESELRESEAKYRELIKYAPAAIYEINFQKKRFTSVNDALCQMSSYSRDELLQMNPLDILDEPSQRLFQERISRWLAGEKPDDYVEYRVLAKDGSERYAALNVTFIRDENGKPRGATVIGHDITERRRAEALLKDHNDAIQEYSRKLEQSNRELENFAFVASHELQEPLRKIDAFGSLLSEAAGAALGETERLYLGRMLNASERMRRMIDDLLALSRVSSAGNPFVPVDLNLVMRAVQDDLEMRIKQTNGKVIIENLPTIIADPIQMHQLFQNLIGNAIKYHQPGTTPIVKISAQPDCEKPAETITLQVADNGIGFEEMYLNLIFQPFQRLHGRNEYEGTGIGLAICKKIVERHHGTITARSKPGEGATFTVNLPVKLG